MLKKWVGQDAIFLTNIQHRLVQNVIWIQFVHSEFLHK